MIRRIRICHVRELIGLKKLRPGFLTPSAPEDDDPMSIKPFRKVGKAVRAN
jgi:hypothetical protein